jgi:hypothetical protein
LDVYWVTLRIKINPVVAAMCLMIGTNIYNFMSEIKKTNKESKPKHKPGKPNNKKPKSEKDKVYRQRPTNNNTEHDSIIDLVETEDISAEEIARRLVNEVNEQLHTSNNE